MFSPADIREKLPVPSGRAELTPQGEHALFVPAMEGGFESVDRLVRKSKTK